MYVSNSAQTRVLRTGVAAAPVITIPSIVAIHGALNVTEDETRAIGADDSFALEEPSDRNLVEILYCHSAPGSSAASRSTYVMELNLAAHPFKSLSTRMIVSNSSFSNPAPARLRSISNAFSDHAVSRNENNTPTISIEMRTSIAAPS